jgi:GT2 family glycosyltransferase
LSERSTPDQCAYPLISVIVPVYNGARFLPELIDNLRDQHYQPLEVILVDDGSTDDSAALAATYIADTPEWRVRCIRQANAGQPAARNAGMRHATGEFIQFLDVDDLLPPDKLQVQARRLLRQPDLDLVAGYVQMVALPGADERNLFFGQTEPFLTYQIGTLLARRRVFERVGGFNESLRLAEDVEFYLRVLEVGCSMVILPRVSIYYRMHDTNMTRSFSAAEQKLALARLLRESVKRRSQSGIRAPLPHLTDFVEQGEPSLPDA